MTTTNSARPADRPTPPSPTYYYRSQKSGVVHIHACTRRGPAPRWLFADGHSVAFVADTIRRHPWLRWCGYCQPTPERITPDRAATPAKTPKPRPRYDY